jgi:hypothetical protein
MALSNHARLDRPSYLMEYRGIQFKLVQERGWKWADHLMTIIPNLSPLSKQKAFEIGQELVNLLSWELRSPMQLSEAGSRSFNKETHLSQVKPTIRVFKDILFSGNFVNNSPSIIPYITSDHQKLALGLFREARASNNDYHAFLFYWHVIDSGSEPGEIAIERLCTSGNVKWVKDDIAKLSLDGSTLGNHLKENVRNAIAHIKRWSGRKSLELNNLEQRNEMAISARIARRFAEAYIEYELGVGNKHLHLMRKGNNGFPQYINYEAEKEYWKWKEAYPRKPMSI